MHKLRSGLREAVAALALLSLAACAGKGCSCVQPIKGGFPVDQRHQNAIQLRATAGLFDYLSKNGAQIIPNLIGGNTFTIPPSCGGSTEICCAMANQVCQLTFDFKALSLQPNTPNTLHLSTDVVVKTVKDLPVKATILGLPVSCNVAIDTTAGNTPTMNVTSDLAFNVDKTADTTGLSASNTNINIEDADINLSGGAACSVANFALFKGIVVGILKGQVATQIQNTIDQQACEKCMTLDDCNKFATACTNGTCLEADGKTCVPSLGIEGRMNLGSALASFAPGLQAYMDILAVAGGYAAADTGLSLGMLGGAQGDPHAGCVPMVPPPPVTAVPQSETFHTDVLPDGATPYHLGIGVHKSYLDTAGWAAFDAGALCLHVGTPTVALLSSKTISLLIPSLADLVHVDDAPMYLALKPSQPPTFTLGKGTFKTDAMGRTVVDDPLLHIQIPGFAIDFFAWVDDRYVRIMTLNADVDLPLSLEVDAAGKLTPVFGDLTKAFTNLTVTNSDLLAESPDALAEAFPMLLGVAVGQLTGALNGISLPALMGLQLKPIAITSTDPDANGTNQFLSIFADISAAKPFLASTSADTSAWLQATELPPTAEFAVGARGTRVPTVILQLDGRGAGPLEYAWSVDGGPWSPYSELSRAAVTDPQFWMQGRHTVDVRARVVGQPLTADPTPARVEVLIDTVAPTGGFDVAGNELRLQAFDAVTPPDALQFRYAVDGGSFGPWIVGDHYAAATALDPTRVRVQVRDEAGNVADLGFHGRTTAPSPSGCNCAVAGRGGDDATWSLLTLAGLALLLVRRRVRLRRVVTLVALGAAATSAMGCSDSLGKGDFESPADEIGRYHDVAVKSGTLYVSAYDDTFGDLVFAKISDPAKNPSWEIVDGVDLTATVETKGDFRHGITDPGPDVGLYTSIGLSGSHIFIAYYDNTNGALKVARGPHPWDIQTIDAGDGTNVKVGMYAALSVDKNGVPSVAYVASGLGSGQGFTSELRVATAANDHPSATDWSITPVDTTAITCAGRCPAGSACVVPSMVNGMPNSDPSKSTCVAVDAMPCAATCTDTQACIMGACTNVLVAPKAPDLVEGTGLFVNARRDASDQLLLVYYDRMQGDLKLATQSGGSWTPSFLDGNDPTTDVGQFATAALAADGTLHVAYVDAVNDQLLYKQVPAGGTPPMTPEIVDDGMRPDGPHSVGAGANLVLDASGTPRVVYQDQHTSDLELAQRAGAWMHQDLMTGIPGYGFYPHQVIADGKLYLTEFVYDRQNGPGAPLGTLQISVSAP